MIAAQVEGARESTSGLLEIAFGEPRFAFEEEVHGIGRLELFGRLALLVGWLAEQLQEVSPAEVIGATGAPGRLRAVEDGQAAPQLGLGGRPRRRLLGDGEHEQQLIAAGGDALAVFLAEELRVYDRSSAVVALNAEDRQGLPARPERLFAINRRVPADDARQVRPRFPR